MSVFVEEINTELVAAGYLTLQRVVLPEQTQVDTAQLYVDSGIATSAPLSTMNGSRDNDRSTVASGSSAEVHVEDFLSRTSARVRPGARLSFGTYFNAFPASYWRRWTVVDQVRLSVKTSGSGAVVVYKSNARGSLQRVASTRVAGDQISTFDLTLAPFGDGGWYWFDLVAGVEAMVLQEAQWQTATDRQINGKVTLEITTLNKTDFCLNNLRILGSRPEALEHVSEVLIVDQGTQKVAEAEGFEEAAAGVGDKLRIIDQDNLGGSGGFSRGMLEAVDNGSDYVLLLDDDVTVEPESINRLLTFAELCKRPTIVGGHMFDLYNRTVLHTFGEVVNPYRIQPDLPSEDASLGHDFAAGNLRQSSWLHRRTDVDYNGWWMCLIPTTVIREIGLALPIFIKWDDAEYGLRAKEHGYSTVSLPGAAVWHVSWIDKDDLVGWQAYFHTRNRLITALLHSPYELGGRVIRESFQLDIKHLVSMQYYTARGRVMALRDLVDGPAKLHDLLATKLPEIRSMTGEFSDSQFKPEVDLFPAPKLDKPPKKGQGFRSPGYLNLLPWTMRTVARQLVEPVKNSSQERPQALIPHQDNKWWRMSQYDSALVSNADGTAVSWYKRDPRQLRKLLAEAGRLHLQIVRDWSRLRKEYRENLVEITSIDTWRKTFEAHSENAGK
ncbi:galactofuranosylgalactofuranosylrhamnosyl-N-acetylglucosaminyl-diphospho-decaprenol beta-1,5/1,6-galactofuranosyltransferase [Psychromicrobium silvestre]|uniref:Galactofuranosylgalactofuranosylrhamnosyl-N-acetylglucosaminyl-diphospho-decaprenol beta-1,5/1,6-galactofuranosyltransferase n=1 Tax=Psychromicrobium silvestre TaxID=1645614 RepID=A0A7Y9S700_9MICC|nr:glycosyltransferase [Psychromicrobium silvestre]NYE94896.1 galactofuranosylgalactofuranosylrhamnosyl-N-acetylglucosaminyl-diphospho-decaprenol beta-1,5/1,6-galactofuranosyltransferase [Psychromicrobium silvestre]